MLRLLIGLYSLVSVSCGDCSSISSNKNPIGDQMELGLLPKLMSLPKQPISVKWYLEEKESNGTGELIALLEFSKQDKEYIIKNSENFDQVMNDRVTVTLFDSWLPEKAKHQIRTVKINDMYELQGVIAYQPNLFTQTDLSPYVNGSVTPLRSGFILVSLYSM